MQTPLMELIDTLNEWADDKYCLYSDEQIRAVKDVITKSTELLEKEREFAERFGTKCIEIAIANCSYDKVEGFVECDYSMATKEMSDYFTKTFTDESK